MNILLLHKTSRNFQNRNLFAYYDVFLSDIQIHFPRPFYILMKLDIKKKK